jgi:serine/threonine-protein kinase
MPDTSRLTAALSDRYAIEREIGSGGMATVYLARDLKHNREVALKVLRADLSALLGAERFLQEISITARLDHPHILTLIDSGEAGGGLYYVLPLVRGESLRAKLEREKQLPLEEAVDIIRQVASALEYAHGQGVVHRDIKPENILLHEGEAVVADFGIALALREAGGPRLTETGLSLGTPQYMSPEQATGDRQLDARSDVYSLGAVLYEMLAGEPPVTGPTVQAVIAKLLTEKPRRVKAVRDTVPDPIDAAVARALAKVPADRFATAADFAAALELRGPAAAWSAPRRRPWLRWAGTAAVLVVAVLGAWAIRARVIRSGAAFVLEQRRQLTFTGDILSPAVSPDGKQLAFFHRTCRETCVFSIEVQDVGSTAARTVILGITAAYALWWSPDRRNLIAVATIGGRWGSYLVSATDGTVRYLTSGGAAFWAGGDSLLVGPQFRADSVFVVRVTSLEGLGSDSIRVAGPALGMARLLAVPESRWFAALLTKSGGHAVWQLVDRGGNPGGSVEVSTCVGCAVAASRDALWLTRGRADADVHLAARVGLDPRSGRLASRQDTVLSGPFTSFSVAADGAELVYDDGTYQYSTWTVGLADALRGRLPDARRVLRSSTLQYADVSPDGARLLVSRFLPSSTGRPQQTLSIAPFDGGRETPLDVSGSTEAAQWTDSVTVLVGAETPQGMRVSLVDVRSGAPVRSMVLPDSAPGDAAPLPDGWAWIPSTGDRVIVERRGQRREIRTPAWFSGVFQMSVDRQARRIAAIGFNAGTFDTLGVVVVPLDGGAPEMWATMFGEFGQVHYLADGSLVFGVATTQESLSAYHLTAPGRLVRIGTIPRPLIRGSVSADLKRLALTARDFHGDAWMSTVARR